MRVTGGNRFRQQLDAARAARGVKSIEVGFYASARYPDGTPVTNVAAWNEFGTKRKDGSVFIPERPFFRHAIVFASSKVEDLIRQRTDTAEMVVDRALAEDIGITVQNEIRDSITRIKDPPNAPLTILWKGSSNPLIDTAFMRNSATYKVND